MGDIENLSYDNCHQKYHGSCKISSKFTKLIVTVLESNTKIMSTWLESHTV